MPKHSAPECDVSEIAEFSSVGRRVDLAEVNIDLAELMRLIVAKVGWISLCGFTAAIVTALVLFILGPTYEAKATFLPPNSMTSSVASLTQVGSLGGLGASLGGLKDPTLIYVGMLKSRTIADNLIRQFDLQSDYRTRRVSTTEKKLADRSAFISGKDSTVTVAVRDKDPNRAADLANAYLSELRNLNDHVALTDAAQRRLFYEQQLVKEKGALADAEVELARTQEKTGLIEPTAQGRLQFETIAETQAQIANREVQLSVLSQSATDENPEVIRLHSQLESLKSQLSRLEDSKTIDKPGNIQVPTSKVPELSLVYVRNQRDVKYHEALYQLLLKQYEASKLDESRSAPVIQIVDYAVIPDSESGPRPVIVILVAFIMGAGIAVGFTIWRSRVSPNDALRVSSAISAD